LEKHVKAIVKKLKWKGPVFTISAVSGMGTQLLCYKIMDYLESVKLEE
jgi:GTP-binding protein